MKIKIENIWKKNNKIFLGKYTFSDQKYTAKWIKTSPHQCATLKFYKNGDRHNILKSSREKKKGWEIIMALNS